MSKDDLCRRWLTMCTSVRAEDLDLGLLTPNDMINLVHTSQEIEQWPLLIEEARSPSIDYVGSVFERWHREAGDSLSLIVVDHLGEITSPNSYHNDYRVATEVATMLANTSEELGIPVLAAAQLSRRVEERENKRPYLSDFRDSGKIEEKATSALLLYRKAYYEAQATGMECGTAPMEIIVAKGRNVGTGTALVDFVPEYPRIVPHTSNGTLPKGI
jgi:replicative DNA helicase